jgi:hypothetical protein
MTNKVSERDSLVAEVEAVTSKITDNMVLEQKAASKKERLLSDIERGIRLKRLQSKDAHEAHAVLKELKKLFSQLIDTYNNSTLFQESKPLPPDLTPKFEAKIIKRYKEMVYKESHL